MTGQRVQAAHKVPHLTREAGEWVASLISRELNVTLLRGNRPSAAFMRVRLMTLAVDISEHVTGVEPDKFLAQCGFHDAEFVRQMAAMNRWKECRERQPSDAVSAVFESMFG